MAKPADDRTPLRAHYDLGVEAVRFERPGGRLEFLRTQRIVLRRLPRPPARVLDVGGGPGAYARWLKALGYEVELVDPVPLHVEQAGRDVRASLGDARKLAAPAGTFDAVLLFGPLYHLTARADRMTALREAARVAVPGAPVFVAAISRFASWLDGVSRGLVDDPAFASILARDLADGQHRNPTNDPQYFTDAFFHRPEDLRSEIADAGLALESLAAVEGPAWLFANLSDRMGDEKRREQLFALLDRIEEEPALLGASAHWLASCRSAES